MAYLDVTPTMTDNTNPSPNVVSANDFYSAGYEAYRAFGGVGTWATHTTAGWIKLDFGSGYEKILTQYSILPELARSPTTWTLQGSNDNSTWVTLDTQTTITGWQTGVAKTFAFSNTTAYRYYMINVTACIAGADLLSIDQITFYTGGLPKGASFLINFL